MSCARLFIFLLACLALSGCYVNTYSGQTVGGTTMTTTSTQVGATARFSAGRASFSSGQTVSPAAPGGQVSLGRGGGLIVAVSLVVAEAVQAMSDWFRPDPVMTQGPAVERISETCSCYRNSNEVTK